VPTYADALGRTLTLAAPPQRIVSLVPSLTEALFAFGLGDRVAGVTRFCVEPPEGVRDKPKVGGTKNVDVAKLLSLRPDLVIANQEENTREDIERIIAAGAPVFVTYARTVSGALDELRALGEMTGAAEAARRIAAEAEQELASTAAENGTAVRVFCPIWRNPWMTVNEDTYIHDMLRVCGGANIFADQADRYPTVSLQEAAHLRPDVVLLPDEPYRFGEKHIPEVIEALAGVRIYLVDGKQLCWYGPRIPESIRFVRRLLRGETGM
jgi:ABC-type Fe3+-hydroxamate transport system substrate-binding protein